MELPKCRTCGERHRLGPCKPPANQIRARSSTVEPAVHSGHDVGSNPAAPTTGASGLDRPRSRSALQLATSQAAGAGSNPKSRRSDPGHHKATKPDDNHSGQPHNVGVGTKPRRGPPRIEDRGKTLTDLEPWKAKGMSRSTWYRRQSEQNTGERK